MPIKINYPEIYFPDYFTSSLHSFYAGRQKNHHTANIDRV